MADDRAVDYYEVLQVNSNAEQETIQRVFRLLAQRFHPDNKETGDDGRFRKIQEADLFCATLKNAPASTSTTSSTAATAGAWSPPACRPRATSRWSR